MLKEVAARKKAPHPKTGQGRLSRPECVTMSMRHVEFVSDPEQK
jgi:hypothetical protein